MKEELRITAGINSAPLMEEHPSPRAGVLKACDRVTMGSRCPPARPPASLAAVALLSRSDLSLANLSVRRVWRSKGQPWEKHVLVVDKKQTLRLSRVQLSLFNSLLLYPLHAIRGCWVGV